MNAELAMLAFLVGGYALIAQRLDRLSIGPALAFVAIGILVSEDVFGPISFQPDAEAVKVLAEVTLTLLLFADASTIRASALRRDAAPIVRLLVVGLPLTILLGTLTASVFFPGVPLGIALLLGSILAPTDAALGQQVVTNPAVPVRIRRLLHIESGLNDGIATPFVLMALVLATAEGTSLSGWLGSAVTEMAAGAAIGIALGFGGGLLLTIADQRRWTSSVSRQLFVLALATSCYLLATSFGGNGFIAAFVGGLAFGGGSRQREESAVRFTETQGSLLAIGVWVAFGLTLAGDLFGRLWDPTAIVYAVVSLTLIRMVPVAISLVGMRFRWLTVLFIGWFGPRGLASIVFLVVALDGLHGSGIDSGPLAPAVTWTVILSIVLHGLTAGPFAARYGRWIGRLGPDVPEVEHALEPAASRVAWSSGERR